MKIVERLIKHETAALWTIIGLYIAVFSAICLWKYGLFAYDALDLAIYNNVLWQTVHGHLFAQTIHPHSYLGDHAELGLLLLAPFYLLLPDPRTLLILQTVALAVTAWPLFLLTKKICSRRALRWRLAPLAIALLWLLNPLVHNINLFEFHFLPFAMVPLFFMLLAYESNQRGRFILFATLALLVREDVALIVAAVGVLAALQKKSWWWRLAPIIMSAAWFVIAIRIVHVFAPSGNYKFLIYYSWLGDSFGAIAINALLHPIKVLQHLWSFGNLDMMIGFGLPMIMLTYLGWRQWLLAAGPLAEFLLGTGGSSLILQTQYAALFLPAIFLSTIVVIERLQSGEIKIKRVQELLQSPVMLGVLLVSTIYSQFFLGPLPQVAAKIISGEGRAEARDATAIVAAVPTDAAVVASYRLLVPLSSRPLIFSAHYVFLGVKQFASGPYVLPTGVPIYLAFDAQDLTIYHAQFPDSEWAKPYYSGGRTRLAALIGPMRAERGTFTLYDPLISSFTAPPRFNQSPRSLPSPLPFADGTKITGVITSVDSGRLKLALTLQLGVAPYDTKHLIFKLSNNAGRKILETDQPLINDLTQETSPNANYHFETDFALPTKLPVGAYTLTVALDVREEIHTLDGIRSTTRLASKKTELGTQQLGLVTINL